MGFNKGFFIQQHVPPTQHSMLFDGVNESINCYNNAAYNFTNLDSFTISVWVKAINYSVANVTACGKRVGGGNGYLIQFNSGNLQIRLISGATSITIQSSGVTFTNNTWYRVAFTYNGNGLASGVRLYVDGVEVAKSVITDTLAGTLSNTGTFTIGQSVGGFWNGYIGHLDIWGIELTTSNMLTDYNSGLMRNTNFLEPANLRLAWKSGQNALYNSVNWYFPDDSGNNDNPAIISTNMEFADRTIDVPT